MTSWKAGKSSVSNSWLTFPVGFFSRICVCFQRVLSSCVGNMMNHQWLSFLSRLSPAVILNFYSLRCKIQNVLPWQHFSFRWHIHLYWGQLVRWSKGEGWLLQCNIEHIFHVLVSHQPAPTESVFVCYGQSCNALLALCSACFRWTIIDDKLIRSDLAQSGVRAPLRTHRQPITRGPEVFQEAGLKSKQGRGFKLIAPNMSLFKRLLQI